MNYRLFSMTMLMILAANVALASTSREASDQLDQSYSRLQSLSSSSVLSIPVQANEGTSQYRLRVISSLTNSAQKIGVLRSSSTDSSDQFFILGKDAKQGPCLLRVTKRDAGLSTEQNEVMIIPNPKSDSHQNYELQPLGLGFSANDNAETEITRTGSSLSITGQTSELTRGGDPQGQAGLARFTLKIDANSSILNQMVSSFTFKQYKELHGLSALWDGLESTDPNGHHHPTETIKLNYECSAVR
jgi:hypothetical protein